MPEAFVVAVPVVAFAPVTVNCTSAPTTGVDAVPCPTRTVIAWVVPATSGPAVAGDRVSVSVGGCNTTVAEANFVVSAWLVAVTVTVCAEAIAAGAV